MNHIDSQPGGPACGPVPRNGTEKIRVHVVFTNPKSTRAAVRAAETYAGALNTDFELIAPRLVPYPLPYTQPPVRNEFTLGVLRDAIGSSEREWTARVCLCRDRVAGLTKVLAPRSIVVVGVSSRWWPLRDVLLVRALRAAGHHVIAVQAGDSGA